MCITVHALLSALVARLRAGGAEAAKKELEALLAAGCPYADIEAALMRESGEAFTRALELLRATRPSGGT